MDSPEMMSESEALPSYNEEPSYKICVQVFADGFKVYKEDDSEEEQGEMLPDLKDALKAVMMLVRDTPAPESEESGFDSVANKGQVSPESEEE